MQDRLTYEELLPAFAQDRLIIIKSQEEKLLNLADDVRRAIFFKKLYEQQKDGQLKEPLKDIKQKKADTLEKLLKDIKGEIKALNATKKYRYFTKIKYVKNMFVKQDQIFDEYYVARNRNRLDAIMALFNPLKEDEINSKRFTTLNKIMYATLSRSMYITANDQQRTYITYKNNMRKAMSSYLEKQMKEGKGGDIGKSLDQMEEIEDTFAAYDNENPAIEIVRAAIKNTAEEFDNPSLREAIIKQNQTPTFIEKHPRFEKLFMLAETHPRIHKALLVTAITLVIVGLAAGITLAIYGAPVTLALITAMGVKATFGYLTGTFALAAGAANIVFSPMGATSEVLNYGLKHSNALITSKLIAEKNKEQKNTVAKIENISQSVGKGNDNAAPVSEAPPAVKQPSKVTQFLGSLFCCFRVEPELPVSIEKPVLQ